MQTVQYPKKIGAGIVGGIAGGAAMYGIMSAVTTSIGLGPNCFAVIMGMITGQSFEAAFGPGIAAHFSTSIAIGAIFGSIITTKKLQITGFPKGIGFGVATGIIAFVVIFLPIATTVMAPHIVDIMQMMPNTGNMGTHQGSMNIGSNMPAQSSMNETAGQSGMNEKSGMSVGSQMNEKDNMSNSMNKKSLTGEKMKMEETNKMMMEETQKMFPMILIGAFVSHIVFGVVLGAVVTPIVKRAVEKNGI